MDINFLAVIVGGIISCVITPLFLLKFGNPLDKWKWFNKVMDKWL